MRPRHRNIFSLLIGLVAVYATLANTIADYISSQYGQEMNGERSKLGLAMIDSNWQLDSIESIFDNEIICQYWSLSTVNDRNKPHLNQKLIYYKRSIWAWENDLISESDSYINPIDSFQNEELIITFDFEEDIWFSRLDTIHTELKMQLNRVQLDSIESIHGKMITCGTVDLESSLEIDTVGLSKAEANNLLKKWELK